MIPIEACAGCHDNLYNGADRRCWSAAKGKMMTRYAIHYMTTPDSPRAFEEVERPSCYRQVNNRVFYNKLPNFVRPEDVVRKRRTA